MFCKQFISWCEVGNAYLGALSQLMANPFEYGDMLLPQRGTDHNTPRAKSARIAAHAIYAKSSVARLSTDTSSTSKAADSSSSLISPSTSTLTVDVVFATALKETGITTNVNDICKS